MLEGVCFKGGGMKYLNVAGLSPVTLYETKGRRGGGEGEQREREE